MYFVSKNNKLLDSYTSRARTDGRGGGGASLPLNDHRVTDRQAPLDVHQLLQLSATPITTTSCRDVSRKTLNMMYM